MEYGINLIGLRKYVAILNRSKRFTIRKDTVFSLYGLYYGKKLSSQSLLSYIS